MYEGLGEVRLKDGEAVEAGRVCGPDLEWAERVEKLLGHKGPIWNWQNSNAMRRELDAEVVFYLLHRDGAPLANMMTATYRGAGHFGHVWTEPADRRKGAAAQVMAVLRNIVIYLCSFVDKPSLAAAPRHFVCHPEESVQLVSTPIRE